MNLLTLDEYLAQARKIMFAQQCSFLTKDEDVVADVAYKMMMADQNWDETKSARTTWRYNAAKYAIMRILTKKRERQNHKMLSLDYGWEERGGQPRFKHVDRIPVTNHEENYAQFQNVLEEAESRFDGKQLACINMRYRDNMRLQDIGKRLGISKQRVDQYLQNAIQELKKCMSKQDS